MTCWSCVRAAGVAEEMAIADPDVHLTVTDVDVSMSEAARVLRPGGTFVGYDMAKTWFGETVH